MAESENGTNPAAVAEQRKPKAGPRSARSTPTKGRDSAPSPAAEAATKGTKPAGRGARKGARASRKKRKSRSATETRRFGPAQGPQSPFPRHSVDRVLRIPSALLEQNAGRDASDQQAAGFLRVKLTGATRSEIASAIKYGFLERPAAGQLRVTELAKSVLRPQDPAARLSGLRSAVLKAPVVSEVYLHYRGENLPDQQFFDNALTDTFHIPQTNLSEFKSVFIESLKAAELLEEHNGKARVLDVSQQGGGPSEAAGDALRRLERSVTVKADDSCFVVMPFAPPLGDYYRLIYEPAITKAGLKPVRADSEIFTTGKIMDQVWSGINAAKVLVAELTSRNPNVFYELGIAHALRKPVVLISATEDDVPFDVRHIRVIYYDVHDPFWGEKLLSKVAENILSAIRNPDEAIFHAPVG